ncbi:mucin-5AC-like [Mustela erminea]|uniref:mucin-5AC-like n=1 Tax=Mustela erminea TaxID=36723 RepID=UPI001386BA2C|nr:mucin-5AC-like [Mustela erminea]
MKIIFQILWVLSLCFLGSQSQERNNGFNQRRLLRSSGQVLARSQSAQVKRFPNPNPPRSISPQYHQNLAGQSLSRSTNSKLLPPTKQLLLKTSIPKNLAKPQTHSNRASQSKLGPTEYSSKTQSRSRLPQVYQNNPIQKSPCFKSPIRNRSNSLHPGPLSYSKTQSKKSQSLPNSSVKRVIRPFKSPSNTIFQQKPQLTKRNPNPPTLQKASLNKAHANELATRARQRKRNPKALVQNTACHTKTHLQPPGGRIYIQPLDPRKRLQPLSQRRRPQSSSRRRHPHPLGQKISNPPIKIPGQIKPCIRPHIQNKPGSHHYHPHLSLSPGRLYPPPFVPSPRPQVQPVSKVVSTRTQVLNTTPFSAIASTTPQTISSHTTSATTTNKISSALISERTSPSDITVSSPEIQVPVTIPPTAATTSNAPATEISTPFVTTTPLIATTQTTPFTTQEITTVHATAGDPTILSNTTITFTAAALFTTTSSAITVQNTTASTNTSSAADTEGTRMTTESGYETTELPYSSPNTDDNYIFETTESDYYY